MMILVQHKKVWYYIYDPCCCLWHRAHASPALFHSITPVGLVQYTLARGMCFEPQSKTLRLINQLEELMIIWMVFLMMIYWLMKIPITKMVVIYSHINTVSVCYQMRDGHRVNRECYCLDHVLHQQSLHHTTSLCLPPSSRYQQVSYGEDSWYRFPRPHA